MHSTLCFVLFMGSIELIACSLPASISVNYTSKDDHEVLMSVEALPAHNVSNIFRGRVVSKAFVEISCGLSGNNKDKQDSRDTEAYLIGIPEDASCDRNVSSGVTTTNSTRTTGIEQFSVKSDVEAFFHRYFSKSLSKSASDPDISFEVNKTLDRQKEKTSAHLNINLSDPVCDIDQSCDWENDFLKEDVVWKGSSSCSDWFCERQVLRKIKGKVVALRRKSIVTIVSPPIMMSGKRCSLNIQYVLSDTNAAMVVKVLHETYTRTELLPSAPQSTRKTLYLGEIDRSFRIQLQIGSNLNFVFAILESIALSGCHSSSSNNTASSPSHLYQCKDGPFISKTQICDGLHDCPHGDDEPHSCKNRYVCELGEGTCLSSVGNCQPTLSEAQYTETLTDSRGNFTGRVVKFLDDRCIIKRNSKKEVLFRSDNVTMPYKQDNRYNCTVLLSVFTKTRSLDVYGCDADSDVLGVGEIEACKNVWDKDVKVTQWQTLQIRLSDFFHYLDTRNATSYFLAVKTILSIDQFVIFDRITFGDNCYKADEDPDVEIELSTYQDEVLIVLISCGVTFMIILLIFVLMLYRKSFQRLLVLLGCWIENRHNKKSMLPYRLSYECPLLDNMNENHPYYPWCHEASPSVTEDIKDLSRCKIKFIRPLGKGAFGEVYEGTLTKDGKKQMAAIKKLPDDSTAIDKKDFLLESFTISKFKHKNIISCLGIRFDKDCPLLLLELMLGGDMKIFLRESRPTMDEEPMLSFPELLTMASDVACGCEYLQTCKFIHRDIAARNCLLTSKNSDRVAKIADFGMARDVIATNYYRKCGRASLPVRWMPPESFKCGMFSTKSDVWAFGVLLWEIFSFGCVPYGTDLAQTVMMIKIENGYRLEQPEHCPDVMYDVMLECWAEDPDDRPDFQEICKNLYSLHKTSHMSSNTRSKTLTLSVDSTDIRNSGSIAEIDEVFEDTV